MNPNPPRADQPERRPGWGRIAAALLIALPLGLLVVQNAFVASFSPVDPARAARLWSSHPSVLLEEGLSEVGELAASGRSVDPALIQRLLNAYPKAPLEPETFLVRGVQAQLAGDQALAGRAFLAARDRNPRIVSARYFMADHYLRTNQTAEGLAEISALVRLVPQSLPSVAPYLAAYAKQPEAAPRIREMVAKQPKLESELLAQLAGDPGNHDLIMYLWSGQGGGDAVRWQTGLLNELVAAGQFERAQSAWARFTGISPVRDKLFDPDFTSIDRPPFGWSLVSGPAGVAEPQAGGRLHIIYYGRDQLVLAKQLLLLSPGSFRLSMKVAQSSGDPEPLGWVIRCLPSETEIMSLPLASTSGGKVESFQVPPTGCSAQALELVGRPPEFPQQVDLTLSQLRLDRESAK